VRYSSRVHTVLLVLCFAASAGAVHLAAQADSGQKAVLQRDQLWAEAVVKGDVTALHDVYADDLVYVHSGGNAETKDEFIRRVETGGLKYESLTLVDPKARVYGDAAVVNGMFDVRVMVDGEPVKTRVVYVHVYTRQGGRWRMVAHQTTRAPAAP
jgi:ketosteroid isomerase-like protein